MSYEESPQKPDNQWGLYDLCPGKPVDMSGLEFYNLTSKMEKMLSILKHCENYRLKSMLAVVFVKVVLSWLIKKESKYWYYFKFMLAALALYGLEDFKIRLGKTSAVEILECEDILKENF